MPALPPHLARPALLGALLAAVVLVAATSLGQPPALALVAAIATLLVVLAVAEPFVALALLAGLEVSQTGSVLGGYGVPSPLVLTQLVAVVSLALATLRGRLRLGWSPVLLGAAVLVVTRALTVLTARDPDTAFVTVAGEVRDMLTLAVALALLWMTRQVHGLVRVLVAVITSMALLTVVQEFVLDNATDLGGFSQVLRNLDVGASTFRHSGPIGDSNFWGRVLVMFAPFAFALCAAARGRGSRLLWGAASATLVLGVWLTQSRGTFLALAAGLAVLLLLAGWRYARWLALTPLLVGLLLVLPATGSRLDTLGDLTRTSEGGGDLSLLLRLAAQQVSLTMLGERPLLGVGAGNYTPSAPDFLNGLPFATSGELDEPLAPHNAFLEFAAEGGVVGLLGLLFFLGTMAYCALRSWAIAARRLPVTSVNPDRLIAAACCGALAAWSVASVVLHVRQFRTLLLLAAVIAALDHLLRERHGWSGWGRRAATPRVDPRPGLVLGLVALLGVLGLTQGPLLQQTASARSIVVLTTQDDRPGSDAYEYDLLTRGFLVPTFVEVMISPGVVADAGQVAGLSEDELERLSVHAPPSLRTATVELVVSGDEPADVAALSQALPDVAVDAVGRLDTPFVAQQLPTGGPTVTLESTPRLPLLVGFGVLWLAVLGVVLWVQLERRYRLQATTTPVPTRVSA